MRIFPHNLWEREANRTSASTPPHLLLSWQVHLTQDVLGMGLQGCKAGGFRRRRQLLCLLCLLFASLLHLGYFGGFGGLGHLWGLGGFGSFLSELFSAGRRDVFWGSGLLRLRLGGRRLFNGNFDVCFVLYDFCCILGVEDDRNLDIPGYKSSLFQTLTF